MYLKNSYKSLFFYFIYFITLERLDSEGKVRALESDTSKFKFWLYSVKVYGQRSVIYPT